MGRSDQEPGKNFVAIGIKKGSRLVLLVGGYYVVAAIVGDTKIVLYEI
jgi:hypothetical protein